MNTTQSLFFTILTITSIVAQANSPIQQFNKNHEKPDLQTIVDFLQANRMNDSLCNKIVYEFTVKKKQNADSEHFNLFINQLFKIAVECEQSKISQKIDWIKYFGFPIKDILEIKDDVNRSGIAGDLELRLDPTNDCNKATIVLTVTKKDHYDKEIWLNILNIAVKYTELCESASNLDRPNEVLKKLGFSIDSIVYDQELETSFGITFGESPLYLNIGFTHT